MYGGKHSIGGAGFGPGLGVKTGSTTGGGAVDVIKPEDFENLVSPDVAFLNATDYFLDATIRNNGTGTIQIRFFEKNGSSVWAPVPPGETIPFTELAGIPIQDGRSGAQQWVRSTAISISTAGAPAAYVLYASVGRGNRGAF